MKKRNWILEPLNSNTHKNDNPVENEKEESDKIQSEAN